MSKSLLQLLALRRHARYLWGVVLLLASTVSAQAQAPAQVPIIYGLGTATRVIPSGASIFFPNGAAIGDQGLTKSFTANSGGNANPSAFPILITNVTGNQKLVGIDSRPLTGQLYALGYDSSIPFDTTNTTPNAQLYTMDPATAVVTPVGSGPGFSLNLGSLNTNFAFNISFDFNPVTDEIRVMGRNRRNYRISPVTGTLIATDGSLAYAGGSPATPGVVAAAYSNSTIGSTSTTLYDIDKSNGNILTTQNPPASGTLTRTTPTLAYTASGVTDNLTNSLALGLDIANNSTMGYLIQVTVPNGSGISSTNLFDVNLATGVVDNKRTAVTAAQGLGFNVFDIAVPITPPVCDAPTNPAANGVTDTGATITFAPNALATNYTVTVTPSGGTATTQPATGSPVTLTGLTPNTNYTVSVVSNCFGGLLSSSAVSTTFTTLAPTCAAPTGLTVSNITNTSATVNFSGNGSATSYTVTTSPATTTQTLPANATSANLTGLAPSVAYTVNIVSNCAGGATAGPATASFTTAAPNPAPTITSLSPSSATAGGASFTLTVTGTNFVSGAVVNFNGTARPTTFGSATSLTAAISASDIASAGSYNVTVTNPAPGGGTSAPAVFTVNNAPCNAPTALSATSITSNSATVTFTGSGTATSYTVTTSPTTTTQTLPANATSANLTGLAPSTAYTVSIVSNCAGGATASPATVSFTTTAAPLTDLTVSSTQSISGSYNNVTVTSTGNAILGGPLSVAGTFTVQTGGTLQQNCQPLTGTGSFVLEARANLVICDPAGIALMGSTGAVQVAGTRTFSPDANYGYSNLVPQAQVTGSGLPSRVLNLAIGNPAGVTLSQAVSVTQVLLLQTGNLNTNGQALTLLSSAAGTAIVDNTGGAVVGAATVQRYIDPTRNPGLGYRHFSSPVQSTTVSDLATSNFTPVVNPAYNTVGNTVTPFPTVFGYDETRVNTSGSGGSTDFDKGFFSPAAPSSVLAPTQGYTVNLSANQVVDFVGTLNNGGLTAGGLTRGGQTESGWHLRGNPYPSALDWNRMVANNRLSGVDATLYVFKSSGQYTGSYASYVNGMSTNGGTNLLPVAQGFFVRASTVGAAGSLTFTNAERVGAYDTTPFQLGTPDVRPQLTLSLRNATATTQAAMYFEQGATAGFDRAFDAYSLPASNGLLLATEAGTEALAINGQPALSGSEVVLPLQVAAATAGTYTLAVDNLANLPAGYHAYLRDALTGTKTELAPSTTVSLTLAPGAAIGGRYALLFTSLGNDPGTTPPALAQLATVYPNPARGSATLLLPLALRGQQATPVSVVDNLGRTVLTRTLAAGATETLELPVSGLAPGVYSVQAKTATGLVVKRLVVE